MSDIYLIIVLWVTSDFESAERKMSFCLTLISPQLQPESPALPEVEMILRDNSPSVDQKQVEEEMDVDGKGANTHK